jgi:hypothetical protein
LEITRCGFRILAERAAKAADIIRQAVAFLMRASFWLSVRGHVHDDVPPRCGVETPSSTVNSSSMFAAALVIRS